jgi:Fic family protein
MKWNWQQNEWPIFKYDSKALEAYEQEFLLRSGEHYGAFKHISDQDKDQLKIELISEEALKSSKIEGENLNRDSIQSSICRQFGLTTDHRRITPAEHGIAEMMIDLYTTFEKPLTNELLGRWHRQLMKGQEVKKEIYRTHKDPMQVISGPLHDPNIHFEAPPSETIQAEMDQFIDWFNNSAPKGKTPLPALTRAGITHLYFVSIHPFEDGNGRIARALSEKSLAQNLGYPTLIALADTIEQHRKDYYNSLEKNNKNLEITPWLTYFAQTILTAQSKTQKHIEFIIQKTKLYDQLKNQLNPRQEKALQRIFKEGPNGFQGGLSAENYIAITKAPRTTATRDLNDLITKGALTKTGELKHTRYFLNT